MVQTRSALKRKATVMPQHRPAPMDPTSQTGFAKRAKERDFYKSYGFDFIVRRPDYSKLLGGVSRRIREGGGPEWGFDVKDLKSFYWQMANLAAAWADQYLITDVGDLPESEIRRLISAANGFCVQMDWEKLRTLLPPTAASTFGHILGELLIQLDIHERLFQNPFWYMDGKIGPDDQSEDPHFGRKLQYLFDRLYQTNPTYSVLWRMQTQRLCNSTDHFTARDPQFGQYNAQRHEAAVASFADSLLTSEPFCFLLKDEYPSSSPQLDEDRRCLLIDVFRNAIRCLIRCETWTNGQPVLRGITELGGIFHEESKTITLHPFCFRPRMDLYTGKDILVVAQPGLVYVDSCHGDNSGVMTEIIEAEVLPAFRPAEGEGKQMEEEAAEDAEDVEDAEIAKKQDHGDEEWTEEQGE